MSKYKRIGSQTGIKKQNNTKHYGDIQKPSYLDTNFLMEKLGMKTSRENGYKKKNHELKYLNENISPTLIYEDSANISNYKSKSQKKRSINDNNNKKKK